MGNTSLTNGVLNETTGTVHKREATGMGFETVCGAIYNVSKESLHPAEVEALVDLDTPTSVVAASTTDEATEPAPDCDPSPVAGTATGDPSLLS